MPANTSHDARDSEGAIRATVSRLSRLDGEGGAVIERAAIVAEGTTAGAIEAWILAHGGQPEAPLVTASRSGLYGLREDRPSVSGGRTPRRYVLSADALVA